MSNNFQFGSPGPKGDRGPQGATGPAGASGSTTLFFSNLASTSASGATTVFLAGYAAVSDKGGGAFTWDSASTVAPDGGTVSAGPGGTGVPGRWVRNVPANNVVNVRHYGAVGDGSTDDTAAIQTRAIGAFVTAQQATGSAVLYFPAGNYLVTSSPTINRIYGGTVLGDGIGSSIITGSGSGFVGALALFIVQDSAHVVVRGVDFRPPQLSTTLTSGATSGTNTLHVNSASQISVGQKICVQTADTLTGEWVGVSGVSGTTITLATNLRNTYSTSDKVLTGCFAHGMSYRSRAVTSGFAPTANVFDRCGASADGSSGRAAFGFITYPEGGGTVNVVGTASGTSIPVDDASQFIIGATYTIRHRLFGGSENFVVAAAGINYSTNTVTPTVGLSGTYTAAEGAFVNGQADGNNECNAFLNNVVGTPGVAKYGIFGLNSLANRIEGERMLSSAPTIVQCRQGGGFMYVNSWANPSMIHIDIGGPMSQGVELSNVKDEGAAKFLVAGRNFQFGFIKASNIENVGIPSGTGVKHIDITGFGFTLMLSNAKIGSGAGSGVLTMSVIDTLATSAPLSNVRFNGVRTGMGALTLTGTDFVDDGTVWETAANPMVPTLANGAVYEPHGVVFGAGNAPTNTFGKLTVTAAVITNLQGLTATDTSNNLALGVGAGYSGIKLGETVISAGAVNSGTVDLTASNPFPYIIFPTLSLSGSLTIKLAGTVGYAFVDLQGVSPAGHTITLQVGGVTYAGTLAPIGQNFYLVFFSQGGAGGPVLLKLS